MSFFRCASERIYTYKACAGVMKSWCSTFQHPLRERLKRNIILMGSPGCGKTTVGRILASNLGIRVVDIDNDYLEKHWGCSVASVVVFIDVMSDDILNRLQAMKVDRIVGQSENVPMSEILRYRQQFYEASYDVRVLCEPGEDPQSVAAKIAAAVGKYIDPQHYVSTRGANSSAAFDDVVLQGLAPNGGLYTSDEIPTMSIKEWHRLLKLTYQERALRILEKWIHPCHVHPTDLSAMITEAYTAEKFGSDKVFPVVHLHDNVYTTELFHGPTGSFKDAALQLMPGFFHHAVKQSVKNGKIPGDTKFLILVATSGDTGSAVLYGFSKLAHLTEYGIKVMVLYPEEGVSDVQKHQMTSLPGRNVHVVGVKSDFDFCQSSIKNIFADAKMTDTIRQQTGYCLSAANSINWGRLLPQVVYHASSYLDLVEQGAVAMGDEVDLCIPTGNFGNILAAYYAKEMGIPFRRLICASNVNNILTEFLRTGSYDLTNRRLHVTASPAIDILKSSNLERYLYHVTGRDADFVRDCYQNLNEYGKFQVPVDLLLEMQRSIESEWCPETDCLQTISDTYKKTGYKLDPHTAVAKNISDRVNKNDAPMLIAGTAHYAKFGVDVLESLRQGQRMYMMEGRGQMSRPANDMAPMDLFTKLELFGSQPKMNDALRDSIRKPVVHNRVLEANLNAVVKEVKAFLKT